jgi:hypothetical protein
MLTLSFMPNAQRESAMALVVTFVTVTALVILGVILRRPESDMGWRDQAEGLRDRMEQKVFPRA